MAHLRSLDDIRDLEVARDLAPNVAAPELRAAGDGGGMPTMVGHFSVFNRWYEINSLWEGRFLERIAPGAFAKTLTERGLKNKVMFNHGRDFTIHQKLLGVPEVVREDEQGAWYEVRLFDTSYVRDLLPGLEAGVYGASFQFRAMIDEWNDEPGRSDHNPDGLPERTIREARVSEFGPVTWPASEAATSGVRSSTDDLYDELRDRDPEHFNSLLARARELRTFAAAPTVQHEGRDTPDVGPANGHPPATPVDDRSQRVRRLRLHALGIEGATTPEGE